MPLMLSLMTSFLLYFASRLADAAIAADA